ncbi:MAG: zinc metallopeptidase [Tissierellia bacterium]|nr:zinc metallopeptidase [Tissierellia bacterium]
MYNTFLYGDYFYLIIPAMLLGLWAQARIRSTYEKYSKVSNQMGLTGYQMARSMLDRNGLTHVQVLQTNGTLSDHYDPRSDMLRLSPDVYSGTSIASIGIAAHEAGHALQDANEYAPFMLRRYLLPFAVTASQLFWIFFLLGFIISPKFIDIGIILFAVGVLFQIVTLPVEFNASKRAMDAIRETNAPDDVVYGSRRVLTAAAMTYVAAAVMALSQLLRFYMMSQRRR